MDAIDTSGKALVDHWKWAAERGLMNSNTAGAFRAACAQVLKETDGWETLDIRALDIDDTFRRFQNKRSKGFKPVSLESYKRRFGLAVRKFLDYANNPASWKASGREAQPRKERRNGAPQANDHAPVSTEKPSGPQSVLSGLVEYPFPLREGRLAYLRLPVDLKQSEVRRLAAYLTTLAIDSDSDASGPGHGAAA